MFPDFGIARGGAELSIELILPFGLMFDLVVDLLGLERLRGLRRRDGGGMTTWS